MTTTPTAPHPLTKLPEVSFTQGEVKPPKVYAFVRFGNESITIKQSLESLLSFCQDGILCYHEPLPGIQDDGSVKIAEDFVRRNPGFRLVKYPLPIIFHNSEFTADNLEKLDRYWLLDCFYNYTLLHLIELAKENGDYDNAYMFKVDCDHIYSPEAFKESFDWLLANDQGYNLVVWEKFNVMSPELLRKEQKGLVGKLVNLFKSAPNEGWFVNSTNGQDHWLVSLKVATAYEFLFVRDYKKAFKEKDGGAHYEQAKWTDELSCDVNHAFITSYHFAYEKLFKYLDAQQAQSIQDLIATHGHPYKGMPAEIKAKLPWQKTLDSEFFSEEHFLELVKSFNYPKRSSTSETFARSSANFDELLMNPEYRMEKYLVKFNKQLQNPNNTKEQQAILNREARVLTKLIHEWTKPFHKYVGFEK